MDLHRESVPAIGTREFCNWADTLAHQWAEGTTPAVDSRLQTLARCARAHSVETVAVRVLADRSQPEVARARAFARVVGALRAHADANDVQSVA